MRQMIGAICLLGMILQLVLAECPPESPCKAASGVFPVPGDCSSFFNCAHCRAFQQQCGPGTLFDPTIRVCNHAHQVQCGQHHSQSQFISRSGKLDERQGKVVQSPTSQQQQQQQSNQRKQQQPASQQQQQQQQQHTPQHQPAPAPEPVQPRGYLFYRGSQDPQIAAGQPAQTGYVSSTDTTQQAQGGQRYRHGYGEQPGTRVAAHGSNRFEPISVSHHGQTIPTRQGQIGTQNSQYSVAPRTHVTSEPDESQDLPPQGVSANYGAAADREGSTGGQRVSQAQGMVRELKYPRGQASESGVAAGRQRYDHSHMAHHPEAVAYASTHQIVFDHPHGRHHEREDEASDHATHHHKQNQNTTEQDDQSEGQYGETTSQQDSSRNNRGFSLPGVTYASEQRPGHYDEPFAQEGGTPTTLPPAFNDQSSSTSFDLKSRSQPSSGYVPSYVHGQMGGDEAGRRTPSYGERIFVRRPNSESTKTNQEGARAEILDTNGRPIEPDQFYTDEAEMDEPFDDGPENRPGALSREDLEKILNSYVTQQSDASPGSVGPDGSSAVNVGYQPSRQFQPQGQQPQAVKQVPPH